MKMIWNFLCVFVCLISVNLFLIVKGNIPKEQSCADPACSEPISFARALSNYPSSSENVLSFRKGDKITILSKSKKTGDYWKAKIGDQIGFVPPGFIREQKVLNNNLIHTVQTRLPDQSSNIKDENNINFNEIQQKLNATHVELSPSQVETKDGAIDKTSSALGNEFHGVGAETSVVALSSQSYKIVEGTLIYDGSEDIVPSSTVETVSPTTAMPKISNESPKQDNTEVQPEIPNQSNVNSKHEEKLASDELNDDSEDDDIADDEEHEDEEDEDEDEEEDSVEDSTSTSNQIVGNNQENYSSENLKMDPPDEGLTQSETAANKSVDDILPMSNEPIHEIKKEVETNHQDSDELKEVNDINSATEDPADKVVEESTGAGGLLRNTTKMTEPFTGGGNSDEITGKQGKDNAAPASFFAEASTPKPAIYNQEATTAASLDEPSEVSEKSSDAATFTQAPGSDNFNSAVPENQPEVMIAAVAPPETSFLPEKAVAEVVTSAPNTETTPTPDAIAGNISSELKRVEDDKVVSPENYVRPAPEETPPSNVTEPETPTATEVPVAQYSYEKPQERVSIDTIVRPYPYVSDPITTESPSSVVTGASATPSRAVVSDSLPPDASVIIEESIAIPPVPDSMENGLQIESSTAKTEEQAAAPNVEMYSTDDATAGTQDAASSAPEPGIFDPVFGWLGFGSKNQEAMTNQDEIVDMEESLLKTDDLPKTEGVEQVTSALDTPVLEGSCKSLNKLETNCEDAPVAEDHTTHFWDGLYSSDRNAEANPTTYSTVLYLVITAVTVLLFTLGCYFIEKTRNDGPLIAKVNMLEQELLVSSKECVILKEELRGTKEKLVLFENSCNDELINTLTAELEESKKIKVELEATVESLQQELEQATEAGLEVNRMLSEVLTQRGGSDSLMESVERLQTQLDSQQRVIEDMNMSLHAKNEENEKLLEELSTSNEKIESLEEELTDIKQNLHLHLKEKEEFTDELSNQNKQLQTRISQLTEAKEKEVLHLRKNIEEITKKLDETTNSLMVKQGEYAALKQSIKSLKSKGNQNLDALFDVGHAKANLAIVEKERERLKERLSEEEKTKHLLEEHVKTAKAEVQKLRQNFEDAEKEKVEAQTKLEVLSKYFKEKEMQLQKELGLQEAMWVQKQGDDSTVYERMKTLQDEVESYKSQSDMLKKEILDQERGLKVQIATLEKKAHENWVAARQAERKLEETKQEAAQLRNRLTMMEKNISNDPEAKQNHRGTGELNGGDTLSPILHDTSSPMLFPPLPLDPNNPNLLPPGFMPPPMFMPPPPGGFMPPPPFLPGDRRPPPLGRMSSPPLNSRFSPPPDYAFGRMSPPPLSPPARNYRSPNDFERDRDRFRHRTPPSPSFHPRNWEDNHTTGFSGFRPVSSQRESRREHKGSTLSSGHSSSDSLDKSSRHSGKV